MAYHQGAISIFAIEQRQLVWAARLPDRSWWFTTTNPAAKFLVMGYIFRLPNSANSPPSA